jgi:hypothetical protein
MPLRRPTDGLLTAPVCRFLAVVIILGGVFLRWWYLTSPTCPLDLAADEAHYWQWSQHLDWSYYSKGPLVAWLIRLGTALLGPWAETHTGSLMPAIRFPAVVCGALLLLGLYTLTKQVFRREDYALVIVAGFATAPVVAVGSALMTIDAPYTCLWTWSLVATHHALFGRAFWAWPVAGLLVGLGILAKYTMALFLPSLFLFLLFTRGFRQELRRPGFWSLLAGAAVVGALPIVIWNAQHDWVTFWHVGSLAGIFGTGEEKRWHLLGPLAYIGGQMAILLVGWFVLWVLALVAHRPGVETDPQRLYLWWLSVPVFSLFLLFSLRTGGGELNWPVTAYLSGLVLVIGWLPEAWARGGVLGRWLGSLTIGTCLVLGLGLTLAMHHTERFYTALSLLVGQPSQDQPTPLRRIDPSCRLRGWRALAQEVDRIVAELRAEGLDPVIVGANWSLPGELGVYCQGHPPTYSIGPICGDRHSQYDFWPGPFTDPTPFLGRPFVCVGLCGPTDSFKESFTAVESRIFTFQQDGHPVSLWGITVLRGFKGFPSPGGIPYF